MYQWLSSPNRKTKKMGSKPDSKRGRVRVAFEANGEQAAIAAGTALGITVSRINRWIRKWARPETTAAEKPTIVIRPHKKGLVSLISMPHCFGRVTQKGDDESEVTWLNGNVTTVKNEWIQKVETGG